MTNNTQQGGSKLIKKEETVFAKGEEIKALSLLLQGRADIYVSPFENNTTVYSDKSNKHNFRICSLERGIFLDGSSLFLESCHSYSCKASEDSGIYVFPAANRDELIEFIASQKDYGAYLMNSLCTIIENSYTALNKLSDQYFSMRQLINDLTAEKEALGNKLNLYGSPKTISTNNLPPSNDLITDDAGFEAISEEIPEIKDIDYYLHLNNMPAELRKSFFGTDVVVTVYNCTKAAEFLNNIISGINQYLIKLRNDFSLLYSNTSESLFTYYLQTAAELSAGGNDTSRIFDLLDSIIIKVSEIKHFYELEFYHASDIDMTYIKCRYAAAKAAVQKDSSRDMSDEGAAEKIPGLLPDELKNSVVKILEYSEISEEKANQFIMNLFRFRNLEDRLSTDENAQETRKAAVPLFFEIYEAVFRKAAATGEKSRLINMFLLFSYMDENLVTQEQALELYQLAGRQENIYHDNVYNMKNWLTAIYNKQREPSINEFGLDYSDVFREMRKRREVTEKDKIKYDNDIDAKVNYEVTNLFTVSQRLCQGQVNTYFPVLHSEIINRDLSKAAVTAENITESINKILEVDFSAFHRELNYRDEVKGIEKELIMKQVMPDIIIVPTYGSNYIMWQEIASRKRNNPGRFILPAFTDERIDDILIRLIGNFRWELCRTIMGSAWNDLTVPSLTSEYTDYIQFFKKNKELTDEAKDKLKTQIQKYHNKSRDIFTADYENWVRYESKGGIRLNKVVRSIMFRYCPFAKPIREQLEKSPIYNETAIKFKAVRAKTARELESRYTRYMRTGKLAADLEQNLEFYKDM